MYKSIAENVDERGVLKISNLVADYGLKETLKAVFLGVYDILDSCNPDYTEPDYQEADAGFDELEVGDEFVTPSKEVASYHKPLTQKLAETRELVEAIKETNRQSSSENISDSVE